MQQMKLYTEEQLVNTVEAIRDYLKNYPEKFHKSMIEKHLKNLEPIELPSDEEIENRYNKFIDTEIELGFLKQEQGERLKWYYKTYFIDKIQGGNK